MVNIQKWDWNTKEKMVADTTGWPNQFEDVQEPYVSPDGEKIASIVQLGEGEYSVCVNGETWEEPFEKLWSCRFTPDGRVSVMSLRDMEWTMTVDGEPWETAYEYIWDPKFSADGKLIVATVKQDDIFGIVTNGTTWECPTELQSISSFAMTPDAQTVAAIAQTVPLGQADVDTYYKGTWSIVVNGKPWENNYVNLYGVAVSDDGSMVAAEHRAAITDHTILVNGVPWSEMYSCTWEPMFHPKKNDEVTAPVRQGGKWYLATNGRIVWDRGYVNILNPRYNTDGTKIAAVVATSFAKWTVAVDDKPWSCTFGECVLPPCFDSQGVTAVAIARDNGKWFMVANGKVLEDPCDNIWPPVFSPDGDKMFYKIEKNGKFYIAVNGKIATGAYDMLWDPILSTNGADVLIRGIEDGKYYRRVVASAAM